MATIQEKLQRVPWERLHHAYGVAHDTPTWLLALLSDRPELRNEALDQLEASLCHQGSLYEASCAAIPFLIDILEAVPDREKPAILSFLAGLAHLRQYAQKGRRIVTFNRGPLESPDAEQEWRSWKAFLASGHEYHNLQWKWLAQLAHRLVGEGMSTYLALLHSSDVDVVEATLDLLTGFQEHSAYLIPAITPLAFEPGVPSVQVAALESLGTLLDQQSPYWEAYQRLVHASDAPSEIRLAAAYTLDWHYSSGFSPVIVDLLVASVLPPHACVGLREVCSVLSQMAMPSGFQGLIDVLPEGSRHWIILDTIRVAEALLDVAFFGGWVDKRYWTILKNMCVPEYEFADYIQLPLWPDEWVHRQGACFGWEYYGVPSLVSGLSIETFGYDEKEAHRLQDLFTQQGPQALSAAQRRALETLLQCEPLWQWKHNLLAIYGLPIERHELET